MVATVWHSFPDTTVRPAEVWFDLPAGPQRIVSLSDFLNRGSLCLLFLPDTAASHIALLEALARVSSVLRNKDASAVAVMPLSAPGAARLAEDMRLPFPLLSDANRATQGRYASLLPDDPGAAPMVFVLDRFGAPRAAAALHADDTDAWIGQALDWIDLADLACPE